MRHLIGLMSLALAAYFVCTFANAQEAETEKIINALSPKGQNSSKQPVFRGYKGVEVIGPSVDPQDSPSMDIRIGFSFDSAQLDPNAMITLRRLGEALSDSRLANYSFVIAGHTDAKGAAEYNQALSEKRAQSVVDFLVNVMDVDSKRLTARGYGKSQLFDPKNPEDGINRRVQIVNIGKTQ
jgi:outer membrane protein OmpA-like peptidoglycan-associated protein